MKRRAGVLWHRAARHKPWSGAVRPKDWHPKVGTRRFLVWDVFCMECARQRVDGPGYVREAAK